MRDMLVEICPPLFFIKSFFSCLFDYLLLLVFIYLFLYFILFNDYFRVSFLSLFYLFIMFGVVDVCVCLV